MTSDELAVKIAGEITFSQNPGDTIKKWRDLFSISQTVLAKEAGVSTSVICDYEGGRRGSPGAKFIKKIVEAIMEIDRGNGSHTIRAYERMIGGIGMTDAILGMREFSQPIQAKDILKIVEGDIVANENKMEKDIYGYTILDSIRAILDFSSDEFMRIYGLTSERALIFTRVSTGRSPLIAIRVSSIKPGLVVLHGLKDFDELGRKLAEKESIPVILSRMESVEDLTTALRRQTT
ncbi:MAG: helix-turn-helix domain-containing protein [Candidatus Hydrothermarchaeales archaeon]